MSFEERLVSGAPSEIYALRGSLLEFHETVMRPERAAPLGIHYLFELYGGTYYRHTATPDMIVDAGDPWVPALLRHYEWEQDCHAAASVVLRIEDAVLKNSVVTCGDGDDAPILYESFRFPDRAGNDLALTGRTAVAPAVFQDDNQAYLYLGSLGSFNYGHWLVDDLPRAKAWMELRRRFGLACIVLLPSYGTQIDLVRVRSLQLLIDPLIDIRFISPNEPCRIRNLYYVTPVSFHPRTKSPAALHFLRSRAMACVPGAEAEATRRLFVARRPPNSRSIVNFDELWTVLRACGFELVEPETLDFAGQVALFQSARIIVGQMGAAMTNSLFCPPATSLIYLGPTGWTEPFYLDLAALGGQQYNLLAGPPADDGPIHLTDFTVPIGPLHQRLAFMGLAEPPAA